MLYIRAEDAQLAHGPDVRTGSDSLQSAPDQEERRGSYSWHPVSEHYGDTSDQLRVRQADSQPGK